MQAKTNQSKTLEDFFVEAWWEGYKEGYKESYKEAYKEGLEIERKQARQEILMTVASGLIKENWPNEQNQK